MNNNYYEKYLKYKNKYLSLKIGGGWNPASPLKFRPHLIIPVELEDKCIVCFEEISNGQTLVKLFSLSNCNHILHEECYNVYKRTSLTPNSCSICRKNILTNYISSVDRRVWTMSEAYKIRFREKLRRIDESLRQQNILIRLDTDNEEKYRQRLLRQLSRLRNIKELCRLQNLLGHGNAEDEELNRQRALHVQEIISQIEEILGQQQGLDANPLSYQNNEEPKPTRRQP
jgi:hypothetical protein